MRHLMRFLRFLPVDALRSCQPVFRERFASNAGLGDALRGDWPEYFMEPARFGLFMNVDLFIECEQMDKGSPFLTL
jgi:hypothetical protein